jgi:tetratricopeptide (TPR) repeat protein
MNAHASARQCPRCKAPAGAQARFCTGCGASLQYPTCGTCGQALSEGARFCTACGASVSPATGASEQTALVSVIAALELALYRGDARRVLEASQDALAKSPSAEEGVVASLAEMTAQAQLRDFEQAQSCVPKARGFYATHLGLAEDQHAGFVREALLLDDLSETGTRDLQAHPWIYLFMARPHGPYLADAYVSEGAPEAERRRAALEKWAEFIYDNPERFEGALGFLCLENKQPAAAARHLEIAGLIARRYECVSPVRIEWLWPLVTLGDAYWAGNESARAVACWHRARSAEMCIDQQVRNDRWSMLALPWIERAKARLAERNQYTPPPDISRQAAHHMGEAIRHIVAAEQFEERGVGLDELVEMIRRAGRRYTDAVARAAAELEQASRLDPYAWSRSPVSDSPYWYRYESANGFLSQKRALAHLTTEKLALAIAAYKQANDFWPTLSSYTVMGGLQIACGLKADGIATYRACIDRAESFGAVDSSDDRREIVAELRQALRELGA